MTRTRVILLLAAVANALGWALPVIEDFRGFHAFRVALSPLWPYEDFRIDGVWLILLSVSSALTNALFVVAALLLLAGRASARVLLWVAAAATLLNLHWVITMENDRDDLEIGYFIWIVSFALLALAAYLEVAAKQTRAVRQHG
jgi:hypothetical protein